MRLPRLMALACTALGLAATTLPSLAEVKLTRSDDRVRVEIDGKLFTEYIFKGAYRPYCYPVLASDGTGLTRDFPMKQQTGEDENHPHHRSLWFAHSDVNGYDFWNQDDQGSPRPKAKILHDTLTEVSNGKDAGVIRAVNKWTVPDGRVFCTDERTLRFSSIGGDRVLDFEVTLRAPADAPVLLGDNKDGGMAVRVAQWMISRVPPDPAALLLADKATSSRRAVTATIRPGASVAIGATTTPSTMARPTASRSSITRKISSIPRGGMRATTGYIRPIHWAGTISRLARPRLARATTPSPLAGASRSAIG